MTRVFEDRCDLSNMDGHIVEVQPCTVSPVEWSTELLLQRCRAALVVVHAMLRPANANAAIQ